MGQAVIGGVITSSLLTLVVVPVVYCYMDDLAGWLRRKLGPNRKASGGGAGGSGTGQPLPASKIERLS
jgi:HAE1 family hydrophobic/amphiphilic exporter-1